MNRRKYLTLAGGLVSPVSGCLGTASSCRVGRRRIDGGWTVERGPLAGFSLALSTDAVQRGGQLTARLRNVTDEEQHSGNRFEYDIQRRTDQGWDSVFHYPETSYWTDEAVVHAPGTGFTWDLTVSRDGLRRTTGQPEYIVCEPLATGPYRFVYWGLISEGESEENERALGVDFRVTEPE